MRPPGLRPESTPARISRSGWKTRIRSRHGSPDPAGTHRTWARIGPPTPAPAHFVPVPDGTDPKEPEFRAGAFLSYHWLSVYTPAGPGKAGASRWWRARAPPSRPWPGW